LVRMLTTRPRSARSLGDRSKFLVSMSSYPLPTKPSVFVLMYIYLSILLGVYYTNSDASCQVKFRPKPELVLSPRRRERQEDTTVGTYTLHCRGATSCSFGKHVEGRLCKSPAGKDIETTNGTKHTNKQTRQQDRSHSCHWCNSWLKSILVAAEGRARLLASLRET
jgi:hypothetical protein